MKDFSAFHIGEPLSSTATFQLFTNDIIKRGIAIARLWMLRKKEGQARGREGHAQLQMQTFLLNHKNSKGWLWEALGWRHKWGTNHLFYSTAFLKHLVEIWATCSGQQRLLTNKQRTAYTAAAKLPAETAPQRFLLKLWPQYASSCHTASLAAGQGNPADWDVCFHLYPSSTLHHQAVFCYTFWNPKLPRRWWI